jgi:glutamate-1-semialdehyde 2,1-aminomutase
VLRVRDDIACVLVNPVQAMHPNVSPPADSALVASDRAIRYDRAAYTDWLRQLRETCRQRRIVLVFDEVMLGFRLARGGVQEYFGVKADMVTYGKSLGGGFPVGVVAGPRSLMRRFRDDRPADICFARGTFNAHPYVMAAMNEFLRHLDRPEVRALYEGLDATWDGRAQALNTRLADAGVPVRVGNMASVWGTVFTRPGRYNWMLQYYLRATGLTMGWIGTGRFLFPHDLSDADFGLIADRFVLAAARMQCDGWWWEDAALTNAAIRRRILRESLSAALGRAPWGQSTLP